MCAQCPIEHSEFRHKYNSVLEQYMEEVKLGDMNSINVMIIIRHGLEAFRDNTT